MLCSQCSIHSLTYGGRPFGIVNPSRFAARKASRLRRAVAGSGPVNSRRSRLPFRQPRSATATQRLSRVRWDTDPSPCCLLPATDGPFCHAPLFVAVPARGPVRPPRPRFLRRPPRPLSATPRPRGDRQQKPSSLPSPPLAGRSLFPYLSPPPPPPPA